MSTNVLGTLTLLVSMNSWAEADGIASVGVNVTEMVVVAFGARTMGYEGCVSLNVSPTWLSVRLLMDIVPVPVLVILIGAVAEVPNKTPSMLSLRLAGSTDRMGDVPSPATSNLTVL